jgi:hypothetical protein
VSACEAGISIREFARREGVNEKLVRRALEKGHLTALSDGKVPAERVGSGWCQRNRRGADKSADTAAKTADSVRTISADAQDDAEGDLAIRNVLAGRATLAEAERVRANGQAVKVMLDARQRRGELMEIADAEALFFETGRMIRDSWMNWPMRVGPLIAADLKMEADRITEVLTSYVHQHLAELGEPAFDTG